MLFLALNIVDNGISNSSGACLSDRSLNLIYSRAPSIPGSKLLIFLEKKSYFVNDKGVRK